MLNKIYIIPVTVASLCILFTCSNKDSSISNDLEQLRSLPYVSWTKDEVDESVSGVITYDQNKTYPGYNLFIEKNNKVVLLDMYGVEVHSWLLPKIGMWEYAVLKDNGNLIAECVDKRAMEVTWDGTEVWVDIRKWHHDIEILEDGSYLMIDKVAHDYISRQINFDRIIRVTGDGTTTIEWSSWEHLEELQKLHKPGGLDIEPLPQHIEEDKKNKNTYDYYHTNTIKVLPFTWKGVFDRRFREGNWLLCLRNMSLIIILDKDTKEILWHWGPGELDWPHMPVMLDNGEILIFDNGKHREYTRIVQVNPNNNKITWEYKTEPPELFFSHLCGSAQPFPNGNILVTDACNGHAFEITKKGEIVWEYFHHDIINRKRRTIYRMIKYPEEMVNNLLTKKLN